MRGDKGYGIKSSCCAADLQSVQLWPPSAVCRMVLPLLFVDDQLSGSARKDEARNWRSSIYPPPSPPAGRQRQPRFSHCCVPLLCACQLFPPSPVCRMVPSCRPPSPPAGRQRLRNFSVVFCAAGLRLANSGPRRRCAGWYRSSHRPARLRGDEATDKQIPFRAAALRLPLGLCASGADFKRATENFRASRSQSASAAA